MLVTNQCPITPSTSAVHDPTIPLEFSKVIAPWLDEILTSAINPNFPIVMVDDNGKTIDRDHIEKLAEVTINDALTDPDKIAEWDEFLSTTLAAYYPGRMSPREWILNAYLATHKLPVPSPAVIYTVANDVIPTAKQLVADRIEATEWIATLGAYARAKTLGISFLTDSVFKEFLTFVAAQAPTFQNTMDPVDHSLLTKLQTLSLTGELATSISLRQNSSCNNRPYAFARVLQYLVTSFIAQKNNPREVCAIPFDFSECLIPSSIVFVNVDAHAHARPSQVTQEWKNINTALASPIKVVSKNALVRVDATQRAAAKLQKAQAVAQDANDKTIIRSASAGFSIKPPKITAIVNRLKLVIKKTMNVNRSNNSYKSIVKTPNKPNRRDPDNLGLLGKTTSKQYKPDLHIYIDTSGSISEANYRDAVTAIIEIARKLNVSLYFNSFSHILSETTLLPTQDRSAKQIYRMFQKVPKVDGGTNYQLVWDFINASKKRKKEISVMITDFEFYPPAQHVDHPKNLYYMPCSCMNWYYMRQYADSFCQGMLVHDPNIRKRMLF